jgi:hypothetical protein
MQNMHPLEKHVDPLLELASATTADDPREAGVVDYLLRYDLEVVVDDDGSCPDHEIQSLIFPQTVPIEETTPRQYPP